MLSLHAMLLPLPMFVFERMIVSRITPRVNEKNLIALAMRSGNQKSPTPGYPVRGF
jgi:hypothetical protein